MVNLHKKKFVLFRNIISDYLRNRGDRHADCPNGPPSSFPGGADDPLRAGIKDQVDPDRDPDQLERRRRRIIGSQGVDIRYQHHLHRHRTPKKSTLKTRLDGEKAD
jgi:hypothetical protein